jgi:hypothetical protein
MKAMRRTFPNGMAQLLVCKDGVVTFRLSPSTPRRLGSALPFYYAINEAHAARLQVLLCKRQYNGEYAVRPWTGTLDEVFTLTKFTAMHDMGWEGKKGEPIA